MWLTRLIESKPLVCHHEYDPYCRKNIKLLAINQVYNHFRQTIIDSIIPTRPTCSQLIVCMNLSETVPLSIYVYIMHSALYGYRDAETSYCYIALFQWRHLQFASYIALYIVLFRNAISSDPKIEFAMPMSSSEIKFCKRVLHKYVQIYAYIPI